MQTTLVVVLAVYIATSLVPISIYFLTKKQQDPSMGYLVVMLIASFFVDGFGLVNYLWLRLGKVSNGVNSVYDYLEFVTVILLYQSQISPRKKIPFFVLIALLMFVQTTEVLGFRGIAELQSVSRSIFAIVVTVLALAYFFKLMRDLPGVDIFRVPMFWINIGMLVSFAGNFFLYVVSDYLIEVMKDSMVFYWSLHNFLGIIAYIFFSIGLWQVKRVRRDTVKI